MRELLAVALVLSALCVAGETSRSKLPSAPGKLSPCRLDAGPWSVAEFGQACLLEVVKSDGSVAQKISFTGDPKKDKTVLCADARFGVAENGKLYLSVYCAEEEPPKVALAVLAGETREWHESTPKELRKGWTTLEWPVSGTDWKTQASGWNHSATVKTPSDLRGIRVLIYNGASKGVLYLQNISYDPDSAGRKALNQLERLRSERREDRINAEKELVKIGLIALPLLRDLGDAERPEVLIHAAAAMNQIEAATATKNE